MSPITVLYCTVCHKRLSVSHKAGHELCPKHTLEHQQLRLLLLTVVLPAADHWWQLRLQQLSPARHTPA
jgi:hypothetical protein